MKLNKYEREKKKKKEWVAIDHSESELDRSQGDDKNTEDNGDRTITKDLSRGGHHAGLPGTHPVPASRVEEWLPEIPPILTLLSETHFSKPFIFSCTAPPTLQCKRNKNTENGKKWRQNANGSACKRQQTRRLCKKYVNLNTSVGLQCCWRWRRTLWTQCGIRGRFSLLHARLYRFCRRVVLLIIGKCHSHQSLADWIFWSLISKKSNNNKLGSWSEKLIHPMLSTTFMIWLDCRNSFMLSFTWISRLNI